MTGETKEFIQVREAYVGDMLVTGSLGFFGNALVDQPTSVSDDAPAILDALIELGLMTGS